MALSGSGCQALSPNSLGIDFVIRDNSVCVTISLGATETAVIIVSVDGDPESKVKCWRGQSTAGPCKGESTRTKC